MGLTGRSAEVGQGNTGRPTMTVELKPEHQRVIDRAIQSGAYLRSRRGHQRRPRHARRRPAGSKQPTPQVSSVGNYARG